LKKAFGCRLSDVGQSYTDKIDIEENFELTADGRKLTAVAPLL
jgi:hypothetical protein